MSNSDSGEHHSVERDSERDGGARDDGARDDGEHRTRSTRRRILLIGAALPMAMALAATLLMVSWLPELSDPIAVHWSGAGPDNFGPALPFVLMPLAIVLAYSVFAVLLSWRTTPSGSVGSGQKILLTLGVWLSALLSIGLGAVSNFSVGSRRRKTHRMSASFSRSVPQSASCSLLVRGSFCRVQRIFHAPAHHRRQWTSAVMNVCRGRDPLASEMV